MNKQEIKDLLIDNFNPDFLSRLEKSGNLDKFIASLVLAFDEKNKQIANLNVRLSKRVCRQLQRQNSIPGRKPGRKRVHDSSWEYFNYWAMLELNENPNEMPRKKWLSTITTNKNGKPLSFEERGHIKKIMSTMLPESIKEYRASVKRGETVPLLVDSADCINPDFVHDPTCTGCYDCAAD